MKAGINIEIAACLIASSFILLWPALYNGFPIVYSDTSTYLASGFGLETPADRPITYGLFILITSLNGYSLWLTAFFQSLILSYIVYLLFKHFTHSHKPQVNSLVSIGILSIISGLPWVSGMLLADVFTPISILTLLLLLFAKQLSKAETFWIYFLFFLSNAMHISHLMINVMLLVLILLIRNIRYFKSSLEIVSVKKLCLLLLISLSGIITMSSAISKSKHIFYMGHMVENGILKKYLDENCGTHNYKLCAYKDSLPPNADRFLWDFKNSPVYKMGGWKACKEEFNSIIHETSTKPEYIRLHIKASIKGTLMQLNRFEIGEGNISFGKETKLYERIQNYVPGDRETYANSKQTTNRLSLYNSFSLPYYIAVYISLFGLLLLIGIKKLRQKISSQQVLLIGFVISGILFNDFICATLSTVANRFACRTMWLLPLLALMIVFQNIRQLKKQQR